MKMLATIPFLLFGLGPMGIGALWAGDPQAPAGLKKARLHLIASESLFGTVNSRDAIASMRIWTDQLGKSKNFQLDAKVEIARSVGQMRQSLTDHAVDVLILDTTEYLVLSDARLVEAMLVGTNRGQLLAFPYLLLTKEGPEARQLDGLRGKRIMVASRTKTNLGLIWLETLLAESRLGRAAGFFGSVEIGYRASACILPLFFGKIDACVVDAGNWESMSELNPQLGRLRVMARSEALLEGLVAMPIQPHPYQSELIESILNLHKTAAGAQLDLIFKTGALTRVGREPFEPVRVLCSKYRRMVDPSWDGRSYPAGRLDEPAGRERR